MVLRLARDVFSGLTTLSTLTVDGKSFGYACEDTDRGLDQSMDPARIAALKQKTRTAIPAGRYRVRATWSEKYQRQMPQVLDVPGYRGIRIHSGNSAADTEGCILPGLARDVLGERVVKSRDACTWLYQSIAECAERGEDVWLEVTRDAAAWASFQTGAW